MESSKLGSRLIKKYCDNILLSCDSTRRMVVKIGLCLVIYATIIFVQVGIHPDSGISGMVAQLQVMNSIYLVIGVRKYGYRVAVSVNLFVSAMVAVQVYVKGDESALPGVILPLGTVVTISIISAYANTMRAQLLELYGQKEEITGLYEELIATQEEVESQNSRLLEFNQELVKKEEHLNYLAYIDVLTELPNRKMIMNRLDFLLNLSLSKDMIFSVVIVDIDNFKRVNDSKGHHVGDLLLREVVARFKMTVHEDDLLGRIGGDEFVILVQRDLTEKELFEYVEGVRVGMVNGFVIQSTEFNISATFGIAMFPEDGTNSMDLVKNANTAMYKSKENGRNGIQFFSKEMKDEILDRIQFETLLQSALEHKEIYLVFQPQYATGTKILRGFEVLARWESKEVGSVSPLKFIPVAEETGFIVPLGKWIMHEACKVARKIQDVYYEKLVISINVSAVQIMDPYFVDMVKMILIEEGVDGEQLEFEITESVFISNIEYVISILKQIKELGIQIALDDFGTGYSSLSYLQRLPIDTLKIDKSFVDGISKMGDSKQMVGSIISLVHEMDIGVVAEGVETEIQREYLDGKDCDSIQGYLWGRPIEKEALFQLLGGLK